MTENAGEKDPPSPLQFPCEFLLKVFGLANDQFELEVFSIVRKHVEDLQENAIRHRLSKDKKYLALTITIMAKSKAQLDAIYEELSSNKHILMVL